MIGISLSLAAVLLSQPATPSVPPDVAAQPTPKIAPSAAPAADTRDARVTLPGSGGVKISMPTFSAAPAPGAPAARSADGLIEVPDNTLGPGEALWQRNDRIDSELKLARAEAFLAERVSTLPLADNAWGWGGGGIGDVWSGGGWGGWGQWGGVGVINTPRSWSTQSWTSRASCAAPNPGTVIHSSAPLAQRQFAEAARPKITHIEDARAEAVRQFGRVAAGSAGPGGAGGTGVPPVTSRKGRPDAGANTLAPSSSRSQPAARKSSGRPRK